MPTTLRKPIDYTFEVDLLIQAQLDALVAQANRFGGELELAIALLLALEKHGPPGSQLKQALLRFLNDE